VKTAKVRSSENFQNISFSELFKADFADILNAVALSKKQSFFNNISKVNRMYLHGLFFSRLSQSTL